MGESKRFAAANCVRMIFFILTVALLYYGCGGGGSSDGNSNSSNAGAVLNGGYILGVNDIDESFVVNASFDGLGRGDLFDLYPVYGNDPGTFDYSVSRDDGGMTLQISGHTLHGVVSEDGTIFNLVETGGEVSMIVGIKKSSNLTDAVLNGEYILGVNDIDESFVVSASFDGAGAGNHFDLYPVNGTPPDNFTYSVNSDGSMTFQNTGHTLNGIVSGDGNVFVLVETVGEVSMIVGIKKSSNMTNAVLDGYYTLGVNDIDESFVVSAYFDGAGAGNHFDLYPINGNSPDNFTYSVNSDGSMTFQNTGHTLNGIVSEDGNVFNLVETVGEVSMIIGIRSWY